MDLTKVNVAEIISQSVTKRVQMDGDYNVTAEVTERNGNVTSINNIRVADMESNNALWEGNANPNVQGYFYTQGSESAIMAEVRAFIDAVKATEV